MFGKQHGATSHYLSDFMKKIAIFASGTGSNAAKMMDYFKDHKNIQIALIVSNKKTAPVLETAASKDIPTHLITRSDFYETENILKIFNEYSVDFVVLAGFLWLIPEYLVKAFPNKIVNVHPALLPKFGGKGMYGMHVHRAVKEAGEKESGPTIHFVNEHYDEGNIIFQAKTQIDKHDTAEIIQKKVLQLEHEHYSRIVEQVVTKQLT